MYICSQILSREQYIKLMLICRHWFQHLCLLKKAITKYVNSDLSCCFWNYPFGFKIVTLLVAEKLNVDIWTVAFLNRNHQRLLWVLKYKLVQEMLCLIKIIDWQRVYSSGGITIRLISAYLRQWYHSHFQTNFVI